MFYSGNLCFLSETRIVFKCKLNSKGKKCCIFYAGIEIKYVEYNNILLHLENKDI
jgi:hypothetical protein